MAENAWADFGSASIKKETDAIDDDWADFGGFESASPAVNGSLQGGSFIPWAAYGSPLPPPDTSGDQQKATHTPSSSAPVPFLPSSSIATTTTELSVSSSSAATTSNSHSPSFVFQDGELPSSSVSEASNVNEPPTDTASGPDDRTEYDSFHSDFASFLQESLTGLSLEVSSSLKEPNLIKSSSSSGINLSDRSHREGNISAGADSTTITVEEKETAATIDTQQPLENTPHHLDDLDNEVSSAQDSLSVVMAQQQHGMLFDQETDNSNKELIQQLHVAEESKRTLEGNLEGLKEELSVAEKEKLQLCQELETLLAKNKELEEGSRNLNESLEKQINKHRELQELHEEQIKEIRKAGHDALAVIVEEYKELSRKAVLEQQAENKLQMETVLEEQRKAFEQFLRNQEEQFQSILQEEKEKNEKKSTSLLEDEKQKHQSEIELCLERQRLKSKEALDEAVEDARLHGIQALQEAVAAENHKYDEFITQQKEAVRVVVDQEIERMQKIIEKTLKEERESSKVALEEALKEEREGGKKLAQQVGDKTKCEMLEYFKGKQEADKIARQKHLHSLDLFLESARTQLKTLIGEQVNKDPEEH